MHDLTTLEPNYWDFFEFLRKVHVPTTMDPSHDENFSLSDNLGELVHSPTSYPSISCSIHPKEIWVKGFFSLEPYEEYETPTLHDGSMMSDTHSLLQHKHPLLAFDDFLIHGCTYDVHLSHLKTHDFPCSFLSPLDVGGN